MTAISETEILKPKDPSITDDNDWPEFPLTNVSIVDSFSEPVSLLAASESNPLSLTGRLDRLPLESKSLALHRDSLPAVLSIGNITRFAYGQYDDGEVAFWAAGEAGWFKIRAGRAYKDLYQEMLEATTALYFAADLYRPLKARQMKTLAAREIFRQYADVSRHRCATTDAAERVYLYHREFLVSRMKKGAENMKWKQTTLLPFLLAAVQEETINLPTPETFSDPEVDYTKRLAGKGKSVLRPKSILQPAKGPGPRETSPTLDGQARKVSNARLLQLQNARERRMQTLQRRKSEAANGAIVIQKVVEDTQMNDTALDHDGEVNTRSEEADGEDTIIPDATEFMHLKPHSPPSQQRGLYSDTASLGLNSMSPDGSDNDTVNMQSQTQLELVYKEQRPYLPVGNLLKKIKDAAALQAQAKAQMINGAIPQAVAGFEEWQ